MKKSRILQLLVVAVLGLTAQLTRADMANGTYSIPLGSTIPLWDISGKYDFSSMIPWAELLGEGNVSAGHGYSLSIDPSGLLEDMNATPEYRAHLTMVMARRALQNPGRALSFK